MAMYSVLICEILFLASLYFFLRTRSTPEHKLGIFLLSPESIVRLISEHTGDRILLLVEDNRGTKHCVAGPSDYETSHALIKEAINLVGDYDAVPHKIVKYPSRTKFS